MGTMYLTRKGRDSSFHTEVGEPCMISKDTLRDLLATIRAGGLGDQEAKDHGPQPPAEVSVEPPSNLSDPVRKQWESSLCCGDGSHPVQAHHPFEKHDFYEKVKGSKHCKHRESVGNHS